MKRIHAALLLAALLTAGCATNYTLVKPERQTVGGVISVEPGIKWNKVNLHAYRGNVEVWTLDGPALNTMLFFDGIEDGKPLFTLASRGGSQEKPPVFRSSMNPLDVQELLQATAALYFRTTLAETHDLKPATIGERGFRFETRLVGRDEVERDGVFVGTIRNGKLYGAWFQGARLHYFYRYLPEFDRMVASAQLVGEAGK